MSFESLPLCTIAVDRIGELVRDLVDEMSNFVAENIFECFSNHTTIFDNVMESCSSQDDRVIWKIRREDRSNLDRMTDVRFASVLPDLVLVSICCEKHCLHFKLRRSCHCFITFLIFSHSKTTALSLMFPRSLLILSSSSTIDMIRRQCSSDRYSNFASTSFST
ncbi:bifunctional (p)ppGpp synthetase/guanosine-3',5'-bis(diphosphate) 3'-pyrophosphohydrolase [Agrobacterium phage OLIVR6]|nr:bifunctional (p)ppGpp synthetase/guanosine-3',5'-bis(diphosphate) 3'-pyrophosphohydrolase [Agrobacterium phage OLIVR6]